MQDCGILKPRKDTNEAMMNLMDEQEEEKKAHRKSLARLWAQKKINDKLMAEKQEAELARENRQQKTLLNSKSSISIQTLKVNKALEYRAQDLQKKVRTGEW